jgi:hypothetical protein
MSHSWRLKCRTEEESSLRIGSPLLSSAAGAGLGRGFRRLIRMKGSSELSVLANA